MKEVIQHLYAHYGITNADEYVTTADQRASQSSPDHERQLPLNVVPERQLFPDSERQLSPDDVPERRSSPAVREIVISSSQRDMIISNSC